MSDTTRTGLIVLGVIFGLVAFWSVATQPTISQTKPSEPLITKNEAFKQAFMGGCNPDGKTLGYCSCLWNKMDAKYTDAEIEAIGNEYSQTGKLTQSFTDFVAECAKQHQTELESV
jgi:hypothetical protein